MLTVNFTDPTDSPEAMIRVGLTLAKSYGGPVQLHSHKWPVLIVKPEVSPEELLASWQARKEVLDGATGKLGGHSVAADGSGHYFEVHRNHPDLNGDWERVSFFPRFETPAAAEARLGQFVQPALPWAQFRIVEVTTRVVRHIAPTIPPGTLPC